MAKANFRQRLGRWIAGSSVQKAGAVRTYQGAKQSYMTAGFGAGNSSADAELHTSLVQLRSRSRQLLRDAPYAKRACKVVVDNVIGAGVGMQAQVRTTRDDFAQRVNDEIESAWAAWSRAVNCHTGGSLHFADLERMAMRQVFDAGEVLIRKHPRRFGKSTVPLALELIEAERLADEFTRLGPVAENATVRLGVEVDRYFRPIAYWIRERHPGDLRSNLGGADRYERVPAEQIFHLRMIDRWPQTRGEPWMHAVVRKLNDMDGYSEAEIYAARASANVVFAIETDPEESPPPLDDPIGTKADDGSDQFSVEPGMGMRLDPGQKLNMASPTRPNTALDPFMRYMLREVAAGINISYESISRDYSQSNFSSSRLGVYEDRDAWQILQAWWIRAFREPLHREWLQLAVLARAIRLVGVEAFAVDPERYAAVKFKPRGWGLIDPAKDVPAIKEAIKGGLMTRSHAISATAGGLDIEDIDTTRERELAAAKEKGLVFDTDPEIFAPPAPEPAKAAAMPDAADQAPPAESPDAAAERKALRSQVERIERQVDMQSLLRMTLAPTPISMTIEPGAIAVHNTPPAINIMPPAFPAQMPLLQVQEDAVTPAERAMTTAFSEFAEFARAALEKASPIINVAAPEVKVEAPIVNVAAPVVNIEPAQLTLEATLPPVQVHTTHPARAIVTHDRDAAGELVRSITTYEAMQITTDKEDEE